ncbi:MAG TPA: capsular biosynthesis protein [Runella sp.]|nr:capsular biosynthesis protein [Runella sp.]
MPFSFLKRNRTPDTIPRSSAFTVDMHAHVLPKLDNGPETLEDALALLHEMASKGIRKVIATPHIMGDYYPNSFEDIQISKKVLNHALIRRCIPIELEVAAEYYLDVSFLSLLDTQQPLLTIANNYLLFETGIVGLPSFLNDAISLIQKQQLTPVLAHPERYYYLQQDFNQVLRLHRSGVLFQVNLGAWQSNHPATRLLAERLINEGLVDFLGSNAHNLRDWGQASDALRSKAFGVALEKGLLNGSLL